MAAKSREARPKRRPPAKKRSKGSGGKPLVAAAASTRRGAVPELPEGIATLPSHVAGDPMIAMLDFTARVMTAYAELPARLVRCRSPLELWLEQVRFVQQLLAPRR